MLIAMKKIDLQCHTTFSDGELTPREVVDLAIKRGIKALAITDHDTTDGIAPAVAYSRNKTIELVPGIEIECDESKRGFKKVDMLGLLIDYKNRNLANFTERAKNERIRQKKLIIKKLNNLGFDISFGEVARLVKSSFGRPHIAKVLLNNYPDEFASIRDVFDLYIGEGKPAYVCRKNVISLKNAIEIVKKAGGVPILAHPGIFKKEDSMELIDIFAELGGEGIETYYPYHIIVPELKISEKQNSEMISFYKKIATSKNLLESGGNDFHGSYRDTLGKVRVPYNVLESLRAAIPARHPKQ